MNLSVLLQQLHQWPIAYYKCYARIMGSVSGGVLLSQLLFHWGRHGASFFKGDKELIEETGLSVREFREAKKRLKEIGWITVTLEGLPARTWYSVNPKGLAEALSVPPSHDDGVQTSLNDGVQTGSNDGVQTGSNDGVQTAIYDARAGLDFREENLKERIGSSSSHQCVSSLDPNAPLHPTAPAATDQDVRTLPETKPSREPVTPHPSPSQSSWGANRLIRPIDDDHRWIADLLEDFEMPLECLDDDAWWQSLSYTTLFEEEHYRREFARMRAWHLENEARIPTNASEWKGRVRKWLEGAYKDIQQPKDHLYELRQKTQ